MHIVYCSTRLTQRKEITLLSFPNNGYTYIDQLMYHFFLTKVAINLLHWINFSGKFWSHWQRFIDPNESGENFYFHDMVNYEFLLRSLMYLWCCYKIICHQIIAQVDDNCANDWIDFSTFVEKRLTFRVIIWGLRLLSIRYCHINLDSLPHQRGILTLKMPL